VLHYFASEFDPRLLFCAHDKCQMNKEGKDALNNLVSSSRSDRSSSSSSNRNDDDAHVVKFGNCGTGDGSFLTRHVALVNGLKQFPSDACTLQTRCIPASRSGGYNYTLNIISHREQIGEFLQSWARPDGLMRPYDFSIKKNR
jgi:hypothetical protein